MLSDGALGMMAAISQALNTFGYTANFPSNVLTNQF
jgi:hypothetical protein